MSTRLIELVEKMPGHAVALVGDFMLDQLVYGNADRLSPEAPARPRSRAPAGRLAPRGADAVRESPPKHVGGLEESAFGGIK